MIHHAHHPATARRALYLASLGAALVAATPLSAQVETIVPGPFPRGLAVANNQRYFAELEPGPPEFCYSSSRIWSAPASGGTPEMLDPATALPGCHTFLTPLVPSGAFVYGAWGGTCARVYA